MNVLTSVTLRLGGPSKPPVYIFGQKRNPCVLDKGGNWLGVSSWIR